MNQAVGHLNEQSSVRTLTVGRTRLTYVLDGAMEYERSGFFPAVPASYWADHPEVLTSRGRVAASVGGLLVQRDGRNLLIDTGLGGAEIPSALGATRSGALLDTLTALGLAPEDIETLAFTHLHADHTGGSFTPDAEGVLRKTFPRADYLVADPEWGPFWRDEITIGAPSRARVVEPLAGVRTLIEDGQEVFPGVTALVTPGHSPGHTTYVVTDPDSGSRVLVLGDAFHTPAQITHPAWQSGPDIDLRAVERARERLLGELQRSETLGFVFHFGDQVFGRVVADGGGRRGWEPVPAESVLPTPFTLS